MYHSDLTDEQWQRILPLLPPQKPKTGRPALNHRMIINAILWVRRMGAPWRHLPARYGSWSTAASRYYRWKKTGIWDPVNAVLTNDITLPHDPPRDQSRAHAVRKEALELIPS